MNNKFTISGGYSYDNQSAHERDIYQLGVEAAKSHGKTVRDAAERAICRFYLVESLSDCNADKILCAGAHLYENGIPFRLTEFSDGSVTMSDISTGIEIFHMKKFSVQREEHDVSCIEDSIKRSQVFLTVNQQYRTFDGIK